MEDIIRKNPPPEKAPEKKGAAPTLSHLLARSGTLARRIIDLMRQDEDCTLDKEIFLGEELFPEQMNQDNVWKSDLGNGFGISIQRENLETDLMTHITVSFHPYNHDKVNLFNEIEHGLSKEWVQKNKSGDRQQTRGCHINEFLKKIGPKGTDLVTITLTWTRHIGSKNGFAPVNPITVKVSVALPDDSMIHFDPLISYMEIREERGEYARMFYGRVLDMLEESVLLEEIILLSAILRRALKGKNILPDGKDDESSLYDDFFGQPDSQKPN